MGDTTVLDIIDTAVKIGLGGMIAGVSGYFALMKREKMALNREKTARKENQTIALAEKQIEFQFETLISLQDTLTKFVRLTGQCQHADSMEFKEKGTWQKSMLPDNVSNGVMEKTQLLHILKTRVRDERIRKKVIELIDLSVTVQLATNEQKSQDCMVRMSEKVTEIFEIIERLFDQIHETT